MEENQRKPSTPMKPSCIEVDNQIKLVSPEVSFARALFQMIQAERIYLQDWLTWIPNTKTEKDVIRLIRESQAFNEGGQQLNYFLSYKEQIVGSVGFVKLNMRHKKGEIGYWISQYLQGYGIITKSCKKLIDYAFEYKALNRVEIRVLSGNEKSIAIPQRLGFQHEGKLKQAIQLHNKFYDMDVFGLLKKEWLSFNAPLPAHSLSNKNNLTTKKLK